jgi:hypothetical protein
MSSDRPKRFGRECTRINSDKGAYIVDESVATVEKAGAKWKREHNKPTREKIRMKVIQDDGKFNPKAQWWCGVILVVLAPVSIIMEFTSQTRVFPLPLTILNYLFMCGLGIFHIRQGAKRMRSSR